MVEAGVKAVTNSTDEAVEAGTRAVVNGGSEAAESGGKVVTNSGNENAMKSAVEMGEAGGKTLTKNGIELVPNKGFDNFDDLEAHLGSPGEGNNWHHFVEQSQIDKRANFTSDQVNNVNNIISIPSGAGSIHGKISAHYSTKFDFTEGLTVRDWMASQSFDDQFEYGKELLEEYGEVIPTENGWVFNPYELGE